MAAKKKQPQATSQFTPTTMALMAMTLLVGIVVGYIIGAGTKPDDTKTTPGTARTSERASAGTRPDVAKATTKPTTMPAKAAQSNSPFLDEAAVAKFEGQATELSDYRRAVDFVSRRNARAAGPVIDRLMLVAGGTAYHEEVALLAAANKVNQNLPQEAMDALAAWKTTYSNSRLTAQAVLWEGKALMASARAKSSARSDSTPHAGQPEYEQARTTFESVTVNYPDSVEACGEALFNLGSVYKSLGQPEKSLQMYNDLVERYPQHSLAARALYSVGNAAWSEEDYVTADDYFKRLANAYPDDGLAKRARKNITALGIIGKPASELVVDHWLGAGGEATIAASTGKVVLLSFWNEWCPHCKREMPKLQQLHEKYADQGLVLIAVTKHTKSQTDEKIDAFMSSKGITFPCAVEPAGYRSTKDYGVSGVPAAAVIDRSGNIVWRNHPARLTEDRLKQFLGV